MTEQAQHAEYVALIANALWDDSMRWISADGRPIPNKAAEIAVEAILRGGYRIVPGWPQDPAQIDGTGSAENRGSTDAM